MSGREGMERAYNDMMIIVLIKIQAWFLFLVMVIGYHIVSPSKALSASALASTSDASSTKLSSLVFSSSSGAD